MPFGKKAVAPHYFVDIAQQLYKYQNFKGAVVKEKVVSDQWEKGSIQALHSLLRKYVATGEKDLVRATSSFYDAIDELKSHHAAILRPSYHEQARLFKQHKRKQVLSSEVKTSYIEPQHIVTEPQATQTKINLSTDTLEAIKASHTKYGILVDDTIKIFNNDTYMEGFFEALSYMKTTSNYKKVKVTYTEVE